MITPKHIKQKALKLWNSGKIFQDFLKKGTLFPWHIRFRKPTAQQQLDEFSKIREWVIDLKTHSNESGSFSYGIEYKISNHRQLGLQQLPSQIIFASHEDCLQWIGKQGDFKALLKTYHQSCAKFPTLHEWIINKPRLLMKHTKDWHKLLSVCDYFIANPRPDCYLRELEITGLDSKFIEKNTAILTELLDFLLPESSIDQTIVGLKQHGFERRYGLKFDEPLIRLRLLDNSLKSTALAPSDLSLPLSQLSRWKPPCWRVFITENKTNGLSFPAVQDSLVIFGLGYGVDSLAEIAWLADCEIYYWGDIDTHGFSILSRLRRYFPKTQAVMMNQKTLDLYSSFCVEEPTNARCNNQLNYLTKTEQALYQKLQLSHQRLEQERLPMSYVIACIKQC